VAIEIHWLAVLPRDHKRWSRPPFVTVIGQTSFSSVFYCLCVCGSQASRTGRKIPNSSSCSSFSGFRTASS